VVVGELGGTGWRLAEDAEPGDRVLPVVLPTLGVR
jgi:hypothetical protein